MLTTVVGRVGVEPTTLKRTDLQSAAFADSLPTHIVTPILWRDRRHRRFFLLWSIQTCVLVYALIHVWQFMLLMGALNTKEDLYGGTDGT